MRHNLLAGCACILLATGCVTYNEQTRKIRDEYRSGKYEQALRSVEKSGLKEGGSSSLLYHLEKAMILDRMDERKTSQDHLLRADKIADDLYTVSLSKTAASFVVNDAVQDYEGEVYEVISIHTMLALSFIADRDFKSARVEARKINTKLYEITQSLGDKHNSYREDAFARFLAGLIYEAIGDIDDAIIDYKKALKIYESAAYRPYFRGQVPGQLVISLYGLARKRRRGEVTDYLEKQYPAAVRRYEEQKGPGYGDLVVVHEVGNLPPKQAKEFLFPFGKQLIRLSFPHIPRRFHLSPGPSGLISEGQGFIQASNASDLAAIAWQCLEDRRLRLILKSGSRLLLKGQLTEQAHDRFGALGGLAANLYSAVTETADTRGWTLLPEAFYISRIRLPVGRHQVTVRTDGRMAEVEKVSIRPGALTLLRSISR